MTRLRYQDFSVPHRLVALLATGLALGLIYLLATKIVFATIQLSSSVPNAYGYTSRDSQPLALPNAWRTRPGKVEFVVAAPGYESQSKTITVWPFVTKKFSFDLKKLSYNPHDAKTVPLYDQLPKITSEYQIEKPGLDGIYVITLFATINRPSQHDVYEKQLTEFATQAVDWIKSQGVNPESLTIQWSPTRPSGIGIGSAVPGV